MLFNQTKSMFQKKLLTAFFISWSCLGFGQELPTEKSEEHLQIKGTNIFMVPPTYYYPAEDFKGFQNPKNTSSAIMVIEIPGPFSEVTKGFNPEMMSEKGMKLISKKELTVGEYPALLIELDQEANGITYTKHVLIYGNEQATTLINGMFIKDTPYVGEKIKHSILTTYVDSAIVSDPRANLKYTINEQTGSLKFVYVMGNGMLFNRDLKIPTESDDKASLITDQSYAKLEIKDQKAFCINRLKNYPDDFSVISSKGIKAIEIDQLRGYELYAQSNTDKKEEMYQVILFNEDGGYYLFAGTYLAGNQKAITDIKNVIQSFKRKK